MAGSESLPSNLAGQDVAHIERLWAAVKVGAREAVEHKEQLIGVTLDSQPVFEGGLALPFVVRLVNMFGPTVREIAKRSQNEFELTLKIENEGGRREELYLRKDGLISALQPLPAKGRDVFAPLGLEGWVPAMTTAPPPVVSERAVPVLPQIIHTDGPMGGIPETLGKIATTQEGPPSIGVPRGNVDPSSNPFIPAPPSSKKVPG